MVQIRSIFWCAARVCLEIRAAQKTQMQQRHQCGLFYNTLQMDCDQWLALGALTSGDGDTPGVGGNFEAEDKQPNDKKTVSQCLAVQLCHLLTVQSLKNLVCVAPAVGWIWMSAFCLMLLWPVLLSCILSF